MNETANKTQKLNQAMWDLLNENNEIYVGKVSGWTGKSAGKYKECCNIEYVTPETLAGTKLWKINLALIP